jgi:biotin transport system ATP-binding protein
MTNTQPALLSVASLNFSFEAEKPILNDISFCVEQGTFTLIAGPNGSGKSLLLRLIKGLIKPNSGSIFLDGEDVTKHPKKRMQTIGLIFQDADTQIVGQTVEKDIRFGMENLALSEQEQKMRLQKTLNLLDLSQQKEQRPRTLSGGEKRRLSIAGVLVMEPKILILDEPFANLDYRSVVSVMNTLLNLKKTGHTIVLVSHEVDKTLAHADQVIILEKGTIAAKGTKEQVYSHLAEHGIYVPKQVPIEDLSWLKR